MSTMSHLPEAVARVICSEMARLGVTPAEVAAATGLRSAGLDERLRGNVPFSLEELDAVAPVLGSHAADLIGRARQESSGTAGYLTGRHQTDPA